METQLSHELLSIRLQAKERVAAQKEEERIARAESRKGYVRELSPQEIKEARMDDQRLRREEQIKTKQKAQQKSRSRPRRFKTKQSVKMVRKKLISGVGELLKAPKKTGPSKAQIKIRNLKLKLRQTEARNKRARLNQQVPDPYRNQQGYSEGPTQAEMMASQRFAERQSYPQQQMPQQKRGFGSMAMGALGALGRAGQGMVRPRQQGYPQQQGRISLMGSQQMRRPINPPKARMSVLGNPQNNMLNAPNIFNNRGQNSIGVK